MKSAKAAKTTELTDARSQQDRATPTPPGFSAPKAVTSRQSADRTDHKEIDSLNYLRARAEYR